MAKNRASFVGLLLVVVLAFAPVIVSHIGCFDDCMKVCQESPTGCIKICNLTCVLVSFSSICSMLEGDDDDENAFIDHFHMYGF
ncbi:unnamed protein product [Musa textilis]